MTQRGRLGQPGLLGRWSTVGKVAALLMVLGVVVSATARGEELPSNPEKYMGMPWLPEGTSTYADAIDNLFYGILYLTGGVFVITEALLLLFILKYRAREGAKSIYSHGNHKLELAWTLIPAGILGTIAILQKGTWDDIKKPEKFPTGDKVVHIQTFAKQFEWNFRYAGADGKWGTPDDITLNNKLVVPVHRPIVMEQTSLDVIHSFFLPNMRLKQDVVPGMQIRVWFEATKTTDEMRKTHGKYVKPKEFLKEGEDPAASSLDWNYEVVCAELCGIQHGEMRGSLTVLSEDEYKAWLEKASKDAVDFDKPEIWEHWKTKNPETGDRDFPPRKVTEEKEGK